MMVTATQLSSYLYCARKLFIGNVLMVEEPPKEELVRGKIWHETYESINNSEESIVTSIKSRNYTEIFDIYRRQYSKILRDTIIKNKSSLKEFNISMMDIFREYWENFEEEAKERALNVARFMEKSEFYGKDLWERLTPKIFSEQYFKSIKLNLSGVVDVIEVHGSGSEKAYIPVELKTGKFPAKGMWDGHRIQLAAYILLLEDSGKTVPEATIKYRGAEKRSLKMNTFLRDEVRDLIQKTSAVLSDFDIPEYTDNKNKCTKCQFREVCYNQDAMKKLLKEAVERKTALKT